MARLRTRTRTREPAGAHRTVDSTRHASDFDFDFDFDFDSAFPPQRNSGVTSGANTSDYSPAPNRVKPVNPDGLFRVNPHREARAGQAHPERCKPETAKGEQHKRERRR